MMANRIDGLVKVNLRVRDRDAALAFFEQALGGIRQKDRGSDTIGEFDGAMIQVGDVTFDVVAPNSSDGAIAKSIERHGEGFDSIALRVDNLDDTIAHLEEMGVRVVNHTEYHGSKIAFIHPKSAFGVLIELIQRPEGDFETASGAPR